MAQETIRIPTWVEVNNMTHPEVKSMLDAILAKLYQVLGWERYRKNLCRQAKATRNVRAYLVWVSENFTKFLTTGNIIPFPQA